MTTYPLNINHIGVSVEDIDAFVAWYREVLGFQLLTTPNEVAVLGEGDAARGLRTIYGTAVKQVKMAHMAAGNSIGLEVFQFIDPPVRREKDFDYTRTSFFHLCLTAPDPQATADRIVAAGGQQLSPPSPYQTGEIYVSLYCQDPFGNVLELLSHSYEQVVSNRDPQTRQQP